MKPCLPAPGNDLSAAAGSLYYAAGDTPHAISAYEDVIQHLSPGPIYSPGEIITSYRLPILYDSVGRRDRAVAVYQRLLAKEPDRWDWMAYLAREYGAIGPL